jgi:uncharacterized damage-inducible protein DinB
MREVDRIVEQLQRAFDGDAWHGPTLLSILRDVNARQAATKPIAHAHSIWEIVLHLITWKNVVRRRLAGEAVEPTPEEDWPRIDKVNESAWKNTCAALKSAHQQLAQTVSLLRDEQLEGIAAGKSYTLYVMLHGVIQHDLYHAGQMALLKKGLKADS